MMYYNYRYYNPKNSRRTHRDPIGIRDGKNLYALKGSSTYCYDILGLSGKSKKHGNSANLTCQQKVRQKTAELQAIINKYSSSSRPKCSGQEGCTLITILVEVGNPCADDYSQFVGHTAISIDNAFYDLGPADAVNSIGYAGNTAPYWNLGEEEDKILYIETLKEAIDNIEILAENPVVSIEFCACKERTKHTQDYWDNRTEDMNDYDQWFGPDAYWFLGLNCSTAVWDSIDISYGTNRAPEELLYEESMITQLHSNCERSGETRPYMKLIKKTRTPH